jgi:hypothetical protein
MQRGEWKFQREQKDYGQTWYLLVRATRNWAPAEIMSRDFGIAVCPEAEEPQLYNLVRQRCRSACSNGLA